MFGGNVKMCIKVKRVNINIENTLTVLKLENYIGTLYDVFIFYKNVVKRLALKYTLRKCVYKRIKHINHTKHRQQQCLDHTYKALLAAKGYQSYSQRAEKIIYITI